MHREGSSSSPSAAAMLRAATALLALVSPAGAGSAQTVAAAGASAAQPTPGITTPPPPAAAPRLNTTGKPIELVVPLRERVPLGQVTIRLDPDDRVTVRREELTAALARAATPGFLAGLNALPSSDGFVTFDALRTAGLTLSFDPGALDLVAAFGTEARPDRTLDLGFGGKGSKALPDTSSSVSAFLAYQASWDYAWRGFERGLREPVANFLLNGRLFNIVSFENQFSYDGNAPRPFTRFGSRLIHDRPDSLLRFQAGDLNAIPQLFQDQPDLAGVGVSRLLTELRPDRVFTASAGRRISLNEPATVTILVNGAPARTLRLDPGNYNLEDLPLTGGANNVELLIEDQAGGRRVVSFDFFQDTELLSRGVDEYDAKAGIRSDFVDGRRRYFSREPLFTGFYRRGLSDQLTAGLNLQAVRDRQQAGLEAVLGSSLGLVTANLAASRTADFGNGYAARLQYRYSSPLEQQLGARRFDLSAEYRSRRFGGIETLVPFNGTAWTLAARYSQPISDRFNVGIGADYQKLRGDQPDLYTVRATAGWRLPNGMQINASGGYSRRDGALLGATLFWRLGRDGLLTAQYDRQLDDARVGYFHSPQRPIDVVAWNVEASRSSGIGGVTGTAVYRGNRGDIELAQRAVLTGARGDAQEIRTSLRARGAIGFADGTIALGRYLSSSFAIIAPHRTLGGATVQVGSSVADQVQARTGALGPALVPLSPYSSQSVYYNVPDAPDGYDVGSGSATFFTWLHGGQRVVVGSDYNVTIVGSLLTDRGTPLALVAGTARRVGIADSPAVPVFTNREGRMGASGLAIGKWELVAGGFVYEFTIPAGGDAFVDLSTLRPTGRRETVQ